MPELPEVEVVCRKLRKDAAGARIVAARILRPRTSHPQKPALVETLVSGRTIETVSRRGKNILIGISGGLVIRVHLRMTGNLYVIPDVRFRPKATRACFELDGGRGLVFEDQRALGVLNVWQVGEAAALLDELGLEPLSRKFTVRALAGAARQSRKPAKLFLMDQRHVAGLGNIYAAEALFRARIHPAKPMNRIPPGKLPALHAAIVQVLREALRSASVAFSRPGEFDEAGDFPLSVYDREGEPCFVCRRKIRRLVQGGRSTYFCPGCQR